MPERQTHPTPPRTRLTSLLLLAILAVLAWPLIAQDSSPSPDPQSSPAATPPPQPDPVLSKVGDQLATKAVKSVEEIARSTTKTLSGNNPSAAEATNAVIEFLEAEIFGFSLAQLAVSFFLLLIVLVFRNLISRVIIARLLRFAERSAMVDKRLVEALSKPLSLLLLLLGVYLAVAALPLNEWLDVVLGNVFRGLAMVIVVWGAMMLTDIFADHATRRLSAKPGSAVAGFAPLLKKSLRIFVLVIGTLMTIDNFGINVTGIIATLGLGTAAIALASQDTLKNVFGTLMIVLDRPFKVGDWIMVGDKVDGDVESIGLRSTKVRTWPKTVLSIPNGQLANEYINNWSRMPKRRVKQIIGITYEATSADMQALVNDFRSILRNDQGVQQDFILVNFTDFGESSLDILVYYFTQTTKWLEHMDIRQRINCKLMDAIHARGLSIAFPTRSLHLDGPAASRLASIDYHSRWESTDLPGDTGPQMPR